VITTTTRFPEIRIRAKRRGPCTVCGKRVDRIKYFAQTVNPLNRVADGSRPKTPAEVRASVQEQADAWDPAPDVFDHVFGGCAW
jgi:hypothetical protein